MNNDSDPTPNQDEVMRALEKILASAYFNTSTTQSRLLRFVVERALAKEEIKANHIVTELYGNTKTDIHRVKSTANIVRTKLTQYHAAEGGENLVRIELPPGPGYRPRFSYNFDTHALRALKRADAAQSDLAFLSLWRANIALNEARALERRYAPIHEAIAEHGLLSLIVDHVFNDMKSDVPNNTGYDETTWRSNKESWRAALALNKKSWRAALVRAWLLGLGHQWDLAAKSFAEAIEFNKENVQKSLSYAAYLIFLGKEEEGLEIVSRNIKAAPQSMGSILLAAFLLYLTRRHEGAVQVLSHASILVDHSDLQEIIFALSRLETNDAPSAGEALSRVSKSSWNYEFIDEPSQPGLVILCHARAGQMEAVREKWEIMRRQYSRKPLQFAIAYMALGRYGRAVACVRRAYRQGDIFTNFIHIMPLFDPLRTHPRFAQMAQMFTKKYGGAQLP
jgi:tetratricopeptide (TPR) repeat protein